MVSIVSALLGLLFFCLLPTSVYLYVERRARPHWGDVADKRAPLVVRATAWCSLALGQMCILWLAVPAAAAGILYVCMRIGHGSTLGYALVGALGVFGLLQSLASFGLFPFGIRVLARNSSMRARAKKVSAILALVNLGALASAALSYFGMYLRVFHPIVKISIVYGLALPVGVFALLSLLLAALMSRAVEASK